jgi:phospholipid transport system substrate-binding protein|tara:strand:- start:676 stop:1296 length:621 start_codon:yes stop_codon:yes gene_type:complete
MKKITMIKKILTLSALCFLLPFNSALSDSKILSPEDYVTYIAQETLDVLGNKKKSNDDKVENITNIFLSNLAVREISLFVLGPYRRNLDSVQKTEYINLIKRFVSEIYSIRLASFPSGDISILSSTDNGRSGIIVKTSIQFSNDPNPTKIDWRLIKKQDGNFKIFDIRVVGIWMAQEQRSTFTSFLSKNNGNIDKLMDRLEKQLSE